MKTAAHAILSGGKVRRDGWRMKGGGAEEESVKGTGKPGKWVAGKQEQSKETVTSANLFKQCSSMHCAVSVSM